METWSDGTEYPVANSGKPRGRWLARISIALLIVSGATLVDTSFFLIPPLQAFAPFCLLLAFLAAGAVMVLRRRLAGFVTVIVCALALLATPLITGLRDGSASQQASSLTVMSFNTAFGQGDPAAALSAATDVGADVLILLEADSWYVKDLDALGAATLWPYRRVSQTSGAPATSVLSKTPIVDQSPLHTYFESWSFRVNVGGTAYSIDAVHPPPPILYLVGDWKADLDRIRVRSRARPGPQVIAGDFNASAAHPSFRAICTGTGALAGCGDMFSKPTWRPRAGAPYLLPLDHILTRGLLRLRGGSFSVPGSDHRAIWQELAIATPN